MAKVVGILKHASVPTLTPSGKKSEARAVDPQETMVEMDGEKEPIEVKKAVKLYVKALTAKKQAEKDAERYAEILRTFVGDLRTSNAVAGDYQKTYRVVGGFEDKRRFQTDVSQVDRWSPIDGIDMKALRSKVGASVFDAVVEEDEVVSIKPEILKNKVERKAFSAELTRTFGIEGVKKYFRREVTWIVREGMDRAQYALPSAQRSVLETGFRQSADSVKDTSEKE